MKITDLKCVSIEGYPTLRIDTDEGIYGLSQIEHYKNQFVIPHVLMYRGAILQTDPTDVERVMLRIRHLGGFKPYGSAVSATEFALWDIAGKALGAPVYKLLGGKIRDKVRVYAGGRAFNKPLPPMKGDSPQDFAERARAVKELPEKYSIIKMGFSTTRMIRSGLLYSESDPTGLPWPSPGQHVEPPVEWRGQLAHATPFQYDRGEITETGLNYVVTRVKAIKEVLGDEVGYAVHGTQGLTPEGTLRIAKALEPFNVMWMEDFITGDYYPYTAVETYRLVSSNTSTPIHTGEQIYLRQGCKELIENHAIDVLGIDPCDVGGIAETKWIAQFADLHGITIAPHGTGNGPLGCATMVHMAATLPKNYIAFEMPAILPVWWDLTKGFPRNLIKDSHIDVSDKPGVGLDLVESETRKHLSEKDGEYFFATKK